MVVGASAAVSAADSGLSAVPAIRIEREVGAVRNLALETGQNRLLILTERNMQYRQIFTDGRPLPQDPNPTWNGYSTARWEGDTLVVQTTGFKDDLWLDASGHPLSSAGKLTERIRRPDYGTLEVEMTIDDPKSYTAPWTVTLRQPLALDSELLDYYCLENEKSWAHMVK